MKSVLELQWYVYRQDLNSGAIEPWNIFSHGRFREDVLQNMKRFLPLPVQSCDRHDFVEHVHRDLMYYFWSKAEYEIVLKNWMGRDVEKKIDVYDQVMLNWPQFIAYLADKMNVKIQMEGDDWK